MSLTQRGDKPWALLYSRLPQPPRAQIVDYFGCRPYMRDSYKTNTFRVVIYTRFVDLRGSVALIL